MKGFNQIVIQKIAKEMYQVEFFILPSTISSLTLRSQHLERKESIGEGTGDLIILLFRYSASHQHLNERCK
jgi:hypothetical protein